MAKKNDNEKKNPFESVVENLNSFKFTEESSEYTGVYVKQIR
jgi:hypothetical protein